MEVIMFKIGEFSKMSGLSIDALHHYEKMALLIPKQTDQFSGYRYYEAEQLLTVNKITALKDANFSLREIADIINSNISIKELLNLIESKANSLEETLIKENDRLNRLRNNIFLIKNGGIPLMNEISIKKVEPILVATIRKSFHTSKFDEELETMWSDVNQYIEKNGVKRTIPCMMLYHIGFWSLDERNMLDVEVVEPVTRAFQGNDYVNVYELPSSDTIACIVHNGSFETIGPTFDKLFRWIKQNNYKVVGPLREIYHKGDWATDNKDEYITELQIPIE
jgi:effector-binding domain-containing protein